MDSIVALGDQARLKDSPEKSGWHLSRALWVVRKEKEKIEEKTGTKGKEGKKKERRKR